MFADIDSLAAFAPPRCAVIRLDRQHRLRFINRFALTRLGYDAAQQLLGMPFAELLAEAGAGKFGARLDAEEHTPQTMAFALRHRDGSLVPFFWNLAGAHDDPLDPAPTVLVGFPAQPADSRQASAQMFQTVADNFSGGIVITDSENSILYANPALLGMTGYAIDELVGRTPALFKSGQTPDETYRSLWETLAAGGIWRGEFVNRRKGGGEYLESKTVSAIYDANGRIQYYFAIGEDLSQKKHYLQRIEKLLTLDQLTGLPNRAAFIHALVGSLESARQEGRAATVLHVGIDDFVVLNDALGASEADRLISELAASIKTVLRHEDRLARLGNEQFAILLGPHDALLDDELVEPAERVLTAVQALRDGLRSPVRVSVSIGIACYPADADNAGDLLSHAMNATEQAKAAGGDGYRRFDAASAKRIIGERLLLNDLRQGFARGELLVHYQPQVRLMSGAVVGFEALVRWQHPERGMVMPGEFIPLAEESHLIIAIGEWILDEVCRQMRAWQDAGLPPVKVAVNLSARHFLHPDLLARISAALARHDIEPQRLEIEITETTMMHDVSAAIRTAAQLEGLGVPIALDDFGTGYSSLAALSRFPIKVVKIDQSFVRDITTNPVNAAIALATIAMAHKLGKMVLAEGVESEEQMQYLRRNECDEMQGYYFSRPLAADAVARLLHAGSAMKLPEDVQAAARDTVLFVDDEANILAALRRTLRREGYAILTAASASEAFALLAKHSVQVIVSDQRMPEMNGTEFLARVKSLYPATVRMVLSGYSEISVVADSINKGAVYRFMLKPWDDDDLKAEIVGALRHWRELYDAARNTD